MILAPKRLRFEKDVITRVIRTLNGQGKFSIQIGQEVSPEDIIGSSTVSLGFRTINLSTQLSVSPKDVKKYLKKEFGQRIYKGELLAYKEGGLISSKKVVVSPTDGILDFLNTNTGELRMSFLPNKSDLASGVFGIVDYIDNSKGTALIRTQVSKIYGVLGTGKSREGIIRRVSSRDDLISAAKISLKDVEHILLGGSLVYKEAVSAAISAGIHGIITGGINAKDYRGMAGGRLVFPRKLDNDIGITIIVCEGFGSIPIGLDVYEILSEFDGRFVTIDGNLGVINLPSFESKSMKRVKATSLPSANNISASESSELLEVKVGQKVRVVGASFRGEQGKVLSVDRSATMLDSALQAFMVTIETKTRKIQMPSTNIEIIGP